MTRTQQVLIGLGIAALLLGAGVWTGLRLAPPVGQPPQPPVAAVATLNDAALSDAVDSELGSQTSAAAALSPADGPSAVQTEAELVRNDAPGMSPSASRGSGSASDSPSTAQSTSTAHGPSIDDGPSTVHSHSSVPRQTSGHGSSAAGAAGDPVRPESQSAVSEVRGELQRLATAPTSLPSPNLADTLRRAEQLILEGAYAAAQVHLENLLPHCDAAAAQQARFLLGLAAELHGDYSHAQQEYQRAAAAGGDSAVRRHAALAVARVLYRLEHYDLVCETLYREVVRLGSDAIDAADAEALHLLALTLAARLPQTAREPDLLDDKALFRAEPELDPWQALQALHALRSEPASAPAAAAPVLQLAQRLGPEPQQIYAVARLQGMPAAQTLQSLAALAGWELEVSAQAGRRLAARTIDLDCSGYDVAFLLDALTEPFGLAWDWREARLLIRDTTEATTPAATQQRRTEQAQRALRLAAALAADHPWTSVGYVHLGCLEAEAGRPAEALRMFQQAEGLAPRGRRLAEIAANLGKLAMQLGDRPGALRAFYRCVDAVDVHRLKGVCYLYIGRLLLEDGRPHEALQPLIRAGALARDQRLSSTAALLLASALLLDDNPQGANTVLMKQAGAMPIDSPSRDAAALLATMARRRSAVDEDRRRRESESLIEAAARMRPELLFGGHWWHLTAAALAEVGLVGEAELVRQECFRRTDRFPLRDRMLADSLQERLIREPAADLSQAASSLFDSVAGPEASASRLAIAQAEYRRGHDSAAIAHLRELALDRDVAADLRSAALRLLGRIYQQRQDHAAAIACFAGTLPDALPTIDDLMRPGVRTEERRR